MPDNGRFPEDEFEKRLEDLGAHVEYPPTPDLASNVRGRIEAEDRRRSAVPRWVAAAVVVLLFLPILAGLVMSGGGGSFGGGSAAGGGGDSGESGDPASRSESDEACESAPGRTVMEETVSGSGDLADSAADSASGEPAASFGGAFEFGELIPLARAQAREESPLLLPTAAGFERPDEVYVGRSPHEDGLVLVYGARDRLPPLGETDIGLILTELDDDAGTYLAGGSARVEEVDIAGERGYWAPNGDGTTSPLGTAERLPGNVLIWDRNGRAFRLQANVEKEEAIRLAGSVR